MKKKQAITNLKKLLKEDENISLCILFGSVLEEQESFNSDIDVAVTDEESLNAERKQHLIEKLAVALERPVDLIDLQVTSGMLLHQILLSAKH